MKTRREDDMELIELLKSRRTIRRFRQRRVSDDELRKIFDCVRFASCAANMQRLRYMAVRSPELVRALFDTTGWGAMVRPNRTPEWGRTAPLCFVAVTGPADAALALEADAGAAIQTLEYAAWSLGIGCCWIGSFDRERCRALLKLPQDRRILYLVAVGYPAESPVAEDASGSVRYYLDDADVLHVPKLPADGLVSWM